MKKIVILFVCLFLVLFLRAQNYRGYNIEAMTKLEAKRAFVIDLDTFYATTQMSGIDTILVSKDYLDFRTRQIVGDSVNFTEWNTAYNDKINSISITGTSTKTITLTQQDGGTISGNFTDISGGGTGDHTALTNLGWTTSGHTGTANTFAAFDGTGAAITILQSTISNSDINEFYVVSDAQNDFTIPFTLKSSSFVFINGAKIPNTSWSGVGTTILNISVGQLKQNDYISIHKN